MVRSAGRPGDADAIARIHVASWRATYGRGLLPADYLARLSVARLAATWRVKLAHPRRRGARVWVAEASAGVVGFVQAGPCHDRDMVGFAGEVFMLYVHPDAVGRGVGRALLARAREALSTRPYYWLVIWVVSGNAGARGFYRRMGLRADGERRLDQFSDQQVPVIRYAMPLNPAIEFARLGVSGGPDDTRRDDLE